MSLLLWLGSLGDRVGRRLPLVVPCVGAIISSISNIVNAVFLHSSPVYMLPGQVSVVVSQSVSSQLVNQSVVTQLVSQ